VTYLFRSILDSTLGCLATSKLQGRKRYEKIGKGYFAVHFDCKPPPRAKKWMISKLVQEIFKKEFLEK
ncbi:6239_t:CDS:1, partial [Racocetra fulgida]